MKKILMILSVLGLVFNTFAFEEKAIDFNDFDKRIETCTIKMKNDSLEKVSFFLGVFDFSEFDIRTLSGAKPSSKMTLITLDVGEEIEYTYTSELNKNEDIMFGWFCRGNKPSWGNAKIWEKAIVNRQGLLSNEEDVQTQVEVYSYDNWLKQK